MTIYRAAALLLGMMIAAAPQAATVWTGPLVTFGKADNADWTLPANQDAIIAGVSLTRASTHGLFNIATEAAYVGGAGMPGGTQWAFAGLDGNPSGGTFSAANHAALSFLPWEQALGGQGLLQGNILDRAGVVHLIDADIYAAIRFTQWTPGFGGGFSYERASAQPVPLPGFAGGVAAVAFGLTRCRRRAGVRR